MNRMHPHDLRALVVAIFAGSPRAQGCTWEWAITCGDGLLKTLRENQPTEALPGSVSPKELMEDAHGSVDFWMKRTKDAENERTRLAVALQDAEDELYQANKCIDGLETQLSNLKAVEHGRISSPTWAHSIKLEGEKAAIAERERIAKIIGTWSPNMFSGMTMADVRAALEPRP